MGNTLSRVVGVVVAVNNLGAEGGTAVALALEKVPHVTSLDLTGTYRRFTSWMSAMPLVSAHSMWLMTTGRSASVFHRQWCSHCKPCVTSARVLEPPTGFCEAYIGSEHTSG